MEPEGPDLQGVWDYHLVTVTGTFINILLSSLLAYGLSLKELPGKTALTFYVFFTMLFNGGLVPTYLMYTGTFHIKNTLFALIVPNFFNERHECPAHPDILSDEYSGRSL